MTFHQMLRTTEGWVCNGCTWVYVGSDYAQGFKLWADEHTTRGRGTFEVQLKDCCWTIHDLFIEHVFPGPDTQVTTGPIVVDLMNDGRWFVEDGRHRVIRALLRGETTYHAVMKEKQ